MMLGQRLNRWSALLVLALLVALLAFILACGEDSTATPTEIATASPTAAPGQSPTATATIQPATTPAQTNVPVQPRLRVATAPQAEQTTMPHSQSSVSEKLIPIYAHLVETDRKTYEEVPGLVTSWSIAPNGLDWTWDLRQNVPFYKDGQALNDYTLSAKDLLLTWDLLIGTEGNVQSGNTISPGLWFSRIGGPEGWEVVNDHRVITHLPRVSLSMAYYFSRHWETGIVSRSHWDDVGGEEGYLADPVGNGSWTYERHSINEDFLYQAVKDHWRKGPEFDELQLFLVAEAATRLAMLLAEEVDMIPLIRTDRQAVQSAGFEIYRSTLPSVHLGVGFIYYRPEAYCPDGTPPPGGAPCGPSAGYDPNDPLRDPNVRLALNHAVDRQQINQSFFNGDGAPSLDYFPPWQEGFKDEWAPYPGPDGRTGRDGGWPYDYNPEKARDFLAEAGFENGFSTILNCLQTHAVVPEWPDICEKIAQDFGAIGVRTELEFVQSFGDFRALTVNRDRGNWMWSASPAIGSHFCDDAQFSYIWELGTGYREYEPVSEFWKKCGEAKTLEERTQIGIEIHDIYMKEAFSLPILFVFGEAAVNPSVVQDYTVHQANRGPIVFHEWTQPVYE